jgi:uncharacterized tellurite resistance protein B-like protein
MKLDAADFAAMDDSQRVAVLEALVVGMLADGKVTAAEIKKFDEMVLAWPWGVDRETLVALIKGAHQRVSSLRTPAEIHDYVAGLAARLPAADLRDKVVFAMASLVYADGDVNQLEKNVLGLFAVSFAITSDRIMAIKSAVTGEPLPPPPPLRTNVQ